MTATDSRQATVMPGTPVYVTSEPQDSDWGQPSVSHYVFRVKNNRLIGEPIGGIYLSRRPVETIAVDSALADEFSAWDTLSDEALSRFETGLD